MINSVFQKIYVITCDLFVDRHNYIRQHFAKNNIKYEFHSAVKNSMFSPVGISSSEFSLALAHLHCIIDAKLNGYEQILICEDDVELCSDFSNKFSEFVSVIKPDWHFLQLGNQYWATQWLVREIVAPNLYRFKWGTGAHCIAIKNTAYDDSINVLGRLDKPVDILYYELFSNHNCYCPEQFLADALSKNDHLQHTDSKYLFDSTIFHKNVA